MRTREIKENFRDVGMKIAIIGAGKMGAWFAKFFQGEGYTVIVSDKNSERLAKAKQEFGVETADAVSAIKGVDQILICVPIDSFEDVVKEIQSHIEPSQIVLDICSIKELPVRVMHKYIKTGTVLGMHPIFGPGSKSVNNKNFILTPTNTEEKRVAEDFKTWLEEKKANVFIMSPRKHDELMSIVLGFPHFVALVVCDSLVDQLNFSEARNVAGASYKMLLTLAEAVVLEKGEFYANLQVNLPGLEEIEALFLDKAKEWLEIVKRRDRPALASKIEDVRMRLLKASPEYAKSYEVMYKMLEAAES